MSAEFMDEMLMASEGFYRPNRYAVSITPPEGLDADPAILRRLMVNCKNAMIPGQNVTTKSMSVGGRYQVTMPTGKTFTDFMLSFYLSKDHAEKAFFDNWINMIIDPDTQRLSYYETYAASTIDVDCLDKNNLVRARYQFRDCYPLSVQSVDIGYESKDQISEIVVPIQYYKWERVAVETGETM